MILLMRPTGKFPDVAAITTVTISPGLKVFALKPKLISVEGAWFSQTQCVTLPLSSVTSTFKKVWGLVQSHAVTTPFMVTPFPSYDAFPWCANTGAAIIRTATTATKIVTSLCFITSILPLGSSGGTRKSACLTGGSIHSGPQTVNLD